MPDCALSPSREQVSKHSKRRVPKVAGGNIQIAQHQRLELSLPSASTVGDVSWAQRRSSEEFRRREHLHSPGVPFSRGKTPLAVFSLSRSHLALVMLTNPSLPFGQ